MHGTAETGRLLRELLRMLVAAGLCVVCGVSCEVIGPDTDATSAHSDVPTGTFDLSFVSAKPGQWVQVPSEDFTTRVWTRCGVDNGDRTALCRTRFESGHLTVGEDGTFELTITRIFVGDSSSTSVLRGAYQRHGTFVLLELPVGDELALAQAVGERKLRVIFPGSASLGFSLTQADFATRDQRLRMGNDESLKLRATVREIRQENALHGLGELPVMWWCNSMGSGWIRSGRIDMADGAYRLSVVLSVGLSINQSQGGACSYNPDASGVLRVLSGQYQRQGNVIGFTDPSQPEWPFYGVLRDTSFTVYRVPVIYTDQESTRQTYLFGGVIIQ